MEPDLLERIVRKAEFECEIDGFGLFNWTEPLLHPRLPEMIRVVTARGHRCDLSSNLNLLKNIDAVLLANPTNLRISCSGFRQDSYDFTHRGGDIEKVKANMAELAEARKRTGASTGIHMLFHRYSHNLQDEPLMKEYCESLGFQFIPVWAFMAPLEKLMAQATGDPSWSDITPDDRKLMDLLLLPVDEALDVAKRHRSKPCRLQDLEITLDFRGDVLPCCAVYDTDRFRLGNYLELSFEEIQRAKYASATCTACMNEGCHVYYTVTAPEFEEIARGHARKHDVGVLEATSAFQDDESHIENVRKAGNAR
jgi:MoaA/NifB/PqqE/SkfB family radical SAM enzyme